MKNERIEIIEEMQKKGWELDREEICHSYLQLTFRKQLELVNNG